jgi:anti-sigma factor RsiW
MNGEQQHNPIDCSVFEERLSAYIDKELENGASKAMAEHALSCPLCHGLLNEVKISLAVCREIAEPKLPVTRLEARILEKTMPESAMRCREFEDSLTDYLDGFLPANVFHRWERHAVLCDDCTDLPGTVVRSLAACVAYKMDELPVPDGLNARILRATLGAERRSERRSRLSDAWEWARSIRLPISVPQLAPVAMMMVFAALFFSQTVSADGSLADLYTKSYTLAEQTYKQGAGAFGVKTDEPTQNAQEPVTGATYVDNEGGKKE